MRKNTLIKTVGILAAALLLVALLTQLPPVKQRLSWRLFLAEAYINGVLHPVGALPTALPQPRLAVTSHPTPTAVPAATLQPQELTATPAASPTPTLSPTPIPASIALPAPAWEKQDINNCGPATLAMYLRYYGWKGDQFEIASLLKPQRDDRNVNVEELAFYVRTRAGYLGVQYRVGGDVTLLKRLLAAGFPVIIEETYTFDRQYWPNDDLWGAHYNLLTGYDDAAGVFTVQDSFVSPNRKVPYTRLDEDWRSFNRVYLLVYPQEREAELKEILGEDWDPDINRQNALADARADTEARPEDAFAWFNLGTNLVYFEEYRQAAEAFDTARQIGLPQRMLRYQFTPFFAYFHSHRNDDLMALTEYALKITHNAEEALLWRGWGLYRQGDSNAAIENFQAALAENPNYQDALYALDFVRANP